MKNTFDSIDQVNNLREIQAFSTGGAVGEIGLGGASTGMGFGRWLKPGWLEICPSVFRAWNQMLSAALLSCEETFQILST